MTLRLGSRSIFFLFVSAVLHAGVLGLFVLSDRKALVLPAGMAVEYKRSGEAADARPIERNRDVLSVAKPFIQGPDLRELVDRFPKNADASASENDASVTGDELGIQASYPRFSRILGESGSVTIEIRKDPTGLLQPPLVKITSGYPRLDQSALEATQNALSQQRLASPLEHRTQMQIRYVFKLKPKS